MADDWAAAGLFVHAAVRQQRIGSGATLGFRVIIASTSSENQEFEKSYHQFRVFQRKFALQNGAIQARSNDSCDRRIEQFATISRTCALNRNESQGVGR
jgi:hypothetical protein